jgi:hypothetical protein
MRRTTVLKSEKEKLEKLLKGIGIRNSYSELHKELDTQTDA